MCSIYLLLIILIPSYTSHELKAANLNPDFPIEAKIQIRLFR